MLFASADHCAIKKKMIKTNQKLLRFVDRTHANIILTLSSPRRELLYSNSLLSKAPQGGQTE
jgi:hypothetical protein